MPAGGSGRTSLIPGSEGSLYDRRVRPICMNYEKMLHVPMCSCGWLPYLCKCRTMNAKATVCSSELSDIHDLKPNGFHREVFFLICFYVVVYALHGAINRLSRMSMRPCIMCMIKYWMLVLSMHKSRII